MAARLRFGRTRAGLRSDRYPHGLLDGSGSHWPLSMALRSLHPPAPTANDSSAGRDAGAIHARARLEVRVRRARTDRRVREKRAQPRATPDYRSQQNTSIDLRRIAGARARNTDRQTDSSRHTVFTIKPYPGPIATLEDRLWSQLDGVLSPTQQSVARLNLHLDPAVRNVGKGFETNAEMVRSSFFGWGRFGARGEVWRVGTWYHWNIETNLATDPNMRTGTNVQTIQAQDRGSAPQPPDEYRRFWNEPPKVEANHQ